MPAAVDISIRSDLKKAIKRTSFFASTQIPFATALAVTGLARQVQGAEIDQMKRTFRNPSPFTLKSVKMLAARKSDPQAKVFVMDKAAQYLDPYGFGGVHKLNSNALLNPKDINLNQYLQLPNRTLARLKGRADIFIGPVKTKDGEVNGVWQRLDVTRKGTAKRRRKERGSVFHKTLGALKLLIRFGDALPVKQHLDYMQRAKSIVARGFQREFDLALAQALKDAR